MRDNLTSLVEIRDAAVHFFNDDRIRYLVFTLGVAALRNFQGLAADWFGRSLAEYQWYILPVGFAHCFQTIRLIDLAKTPDVVANLLRAAAEAQRRAAGGRCAFASAVAAA